MSVVFPQRMSLALRSSVIVAFGALWATGGLWLVLHYFFAQPSDFGQVENPWSPVILRIHGWIAVSGVFLLGWITARHVSERWPQMVKRASGISMAAVAGILALTGYALYYTTDRVHDGAGVAHEIIGVAALLFALAHWRRYRPPRKRR